MLQKFLSRKFALAAMPIASFAKKRPLHPWEDDSGETPPEPFYYKPLPQTIYKGRFVEGKRFEDFKGLDPMELHPHSLWVTQGKGNERPHTGKYWDKKDIGHYECVTCGNQLFTSDQKIDKNMGGVANFWDYQRSAIDLAEDIEEIKVDDENLCSKLYDNTSFTHRMTCRRCKSHLGVAHKTGPPPTFKRYEVVSGAVNFVDKPWWHPPHFYRKRMEAYWLKRTENKKAIAKRVLASHRRKKIIVDKYEVRELEAHTRLENPAGYTTKVVEPEVKDKFFRKRYKKKESAKKE